MITLYNLGLDAKFAKYGDPRLREPKKPIHYYFPIKNVFDSVYRKTSLIGKSRKTKEGFSRLDEIALTQDEDDIFLDIANDAGLEIFTKVNGFVSNDEPSYLFNDGVDNTHIRYKNNGKEITLNSFSSKNYALRTNIIFVAALEDYLMDCETSVARLLGIPDVDAATLIQGAPFVLFSDIDTEEALVIQKSFENIGIVEFDPFVEVKFLSPKVGFEANCISELVALLTITNSEAADMIANAPFVLYERISQRDFGNAAIFQGIANVEVTPIYDGFEYEFDISLDKPLEENDQLNVNILSLYNHFDFMGDLIERPYANLHLLTGAETSFKERYVIIPELDTEPSLFPDILPEKFNSVLSFGIESMKIDFITPDLVYPFDWVEYTENGVMNLFLTLVETDMNSLIPDEEVYRLMEDDVRYSIHYLVLQPTWVANNATIKTDKSIFEAIVAYVIYKWFLIVFPEEAELYLEECKDRLRDVKMNLSLPTGRMPIISNPF